MRVLVADDNSEIRSALRLVLHELWPASLVEEARDAAEAVRWLDGDGTDIVLFDWELPGLDAERFLGDVDVRFPECCTIAMSSRPEVREQSLAAGAAHFVGTNDSPQRLIDLLRKIGCSQSSGLTE